MHSMQCPCACPSLALLAGLGQRCPSCFAHTSRSMVVPGQALSLLSCEPLGAWGWEHVCC